MARPDRSSPVVGNRDDDRDRTAYVAMIERLRGFLDTLAAAAPDAGTAAALDAELAGWTDRLTPFAVDERRRMFGRIAGDPSHGQTMCPAVVVAARDDDHIAGHVTFGRYFLGGNGAAHGGAITLMFDRLLGMLANAGGRKMARTAYLHLDYRAITPIDVALTASARIVSIDGRKRLIRGELRQGERVCSEAEGLFVELLEGQP